ncbi:hypothetical protein [Streptomyces bambusae]|uniref:Uncharacterized protein n=1 Tax=Streptomyces bambusae TaxID=1550616 RepID=A0ABS6Z7K3_9ACTN|nr:hypothetical protein [Streptomyces bambusae]MBW5483743.1 hypothetical protein [Streptomyces bambusae]
MAGNEPSAADYVDAAQEMADTGHPLLAKLLAEEAANRTPDPTAAADILRQFGGRVLPANGDR